MVVDCSRSMETEPPDFSWEDQKIFRLEGAKKMFRLFLQGGTAPDGTVLPGRPQDLVSFIKYGTHPDTVCPLTLDHAVLLTYLKDLTVYPQGKSTSNPGDAVGLALIGLQKAPVKRKVIILLTDGESNVKARLWSSQRAADMAKAEKVPIYAIDVLPDSFSDADSEQARKSLRNMAEVSSGRYFKAPAPRPSPRFTPKSTAWKERHRDVRIQQVL